ncbi:hypothetical protein [Verminephrobacter aporrectodeae]|uniref:hypothetical protein n=1 Tax=Verminephrobacter aporrectodeae TaxID=1110389 RepID=UPI003908A2EC
MPTSITLSTEWLESTAARVLEAAGSLPAEARQVGRQPGAREPQQPRFARRGHAAALYRRGGRGGPEAECRRPADGLRRNWLFICASTSLYAITLNAKGVL